MKLICTLAAAVALATPAAAWTNLDTSTTTMPMGNGWLSERTTGPNGYWANTTIVPMGNGWTSSHTRDSRGNFISCTTMPMGNGWERTNCH